MNKEEFYKKIKQTEKDNNEKDPCLHCGPGNGCDDCRGCSDAQVSHKLYLDLKKLKDEYKEKYGGDYDKEKDKEIFEKRFEYLKKQIDETNSKCKECYGNLNDDCLYCDILEEKLSHVRAIKFWKKEYKSKYNEDYMLNTSKYVMDAKNSFIISAEDARKLVQKEKENDNKCLEPIMEKIKTAIQKKDCYCYYKVPEDYVINKLRNLGYNIDLVKGDRPFDTDCIKISW